MSKQWPFPPKGNTPDEAKQRILSTILPRALIEVLAERQRQDAKWGQQDHDPDRYFAILAEEFGEVAKEVVEYGSAHYVVQGRFIERMRAELIQTAAVAVAMIEMLDRRKNPDEPWQAPPPGMAFA